MIYNQLTSEDSMSEKFKDAITNFVLHKNEFNHITKLIGYQLSQCINKRVNELSRNTYPLSQEPIEAHLIEAFKDYKSARYDEKPDVEDYIYKCEFCEEAYRLVQERKLIKAKLGHAKRNITRLGNIELKLKLASQ